MEEGDDIIWKKGMILFLLIQVTKKVHINSDSELDIINSNVSMIQLFIRERDVYKHDTTVY